MFEATKEETASITRVDVWFDWSQTKVWYVSAYDAEGNLVGNSVDDAHKAPSVFFAKEFVAELEERFGKEIELRIGTRDGGF
jgi:hypothetical protein